MDDFDPHDLTLRQLQILWTVAHAGSLWVESKTGKACTFFLRVRPDGTR